MPANLRDAGELMRQSEFVKDVVGEESRNLFGHFAEHEWQVAQAHVSDWELNRYFDRI